MVNSCLSKATVPVAVPPNSSGPEMTPTISPRGHQLLSSALWTCLGEESIPRVWAWKCPGYSGTRWLVKAGLLDSKLSGCIQSPAFPYLFPKANPAREFLF